MNGGPRTNVFGLPHASDAARRAADAVNLHIDALGAQSAGKWVAIRLSDGTSDGVLYDIRKEAVMHQLHESQCMYVCIPPFGQMVKPYEMEAFLTLHRSMYDAGYRLQDPSDPGVIQPLTSVAAPRRGARLARPYRGEWK